VEDGAVVVVVAEFEDPTFDGDPVLVELPVVDVVPFPFEVELEDGAALEPGCSRATATAITAVAPVTASKTPCVT
jgi:hypothetical protein